MSWPNPDLPLFGLEPEEADIATANLLWRLRAQFIAEGGSPNSQYCENLWDRILELPFWRARAVYTGERGRRMRLVRAAADRIAARVAAREAADREAAALEAAREAARIERRRALSRLAELRYLVERCPLYRQWEGREGRDRFEAFWDREELMEHLRTLPPARR